jgi:hypothetical protein
MSMGSGLRLPCTEDCAFCGTPLRYATEPVVAACVFCGLVSSTLIICPEGHFVCDACHGKAAIEAVSELLEHTVSKDPIEILELVLEHPSLPMHGPEHHALVPAILMAALRNAEHPVPPNVVRQALDRGGRIPGGWCGFYGDCGAAVGAGVAIALVTGSTPLLGHRRSLAMGATAEALARMVDDQPRCCKRASRIAVQAATEYLEEKMGIRLPSSGTRPKCRQSHRNRECPREPCPYFDNTV